MDLSLDSCNIHPLPKDWSQLSFLVNFQSRTILKDLFTLLEAAGGVAWLQEEGWAPSSGYWIIQDSEYLWGTSVHSSGGYKRKRKAVLALFCLVYSIPRALRTLRDRRKQRWGPENKRGHVTGTQEPSIETVRWRSPFSNHLFCFPNWGLQTPRTPWCCAKVGAWLKTLEKHWLLM